MLKFSLLLVVVYIYIHRRRTASWRLPGTMICINMLCNREHIPVPGIGNRKGVRVPVFQRILLILIGCRLKFVCIIIRKRNGLIFNRGAPGIIPVRMYAGITGMFFVTR